MAVEPWNRDKALEQVGGDPELLNELIGLFLDDSDELMKQLASALSASDFEQVEHVAHSLKGSVVNFAADRTRDLAFELEKMGRARDLSAAADTFSLLEGEYAQLSLSMRNDEPSVP